MVEQSPFSYQNIPGMVYRARPDWSTEIIFNSENVCGFTIEEFGSGKVNWFNIIHPDDRERIVEESSSIRERPRSTMQEYRIIDKGGAVRWVEDYKTSLFSEDGVLKGIDGIVFDVTRRKKTEAKLQESEEKFHVFIDAAEDGIATIDERGKITQWNSACEKIFGYTKEEVRGKTLQILMPPDRVDGFDQARKRISTDLKDKNSGEMSRGPMSVSGIRKGGSLVQTELSISYFAQGSKWQGLAIIRDVTERKQLEAGLRKSEEKFRSIVENSSDQIFMLDRDCRFLFINKPAADIFGLSPQEIVDRSMFEVLPETVSTQFSINIKNVFDTGKSLLIEEKMFVKGLELYSSTSLNPVRDDSGRVIAVTGIVRDVTERRKTEKALHESEERFRVIFEGANDGILVADAKTQKFVLANPQMCEMVGYPLEDLLKMSVPDIHPKESLAYVNDQFTKMQNEELIIAKDIPLLRSDKQIVYCEVSARLLEIWKIQCLVGFFRDVTERKKAEKALVESNSSLEKRLSEINMLQKNLENTNKLLGQSNVDLENYTYVVSHDLKAPLRAIRSFSTFLLEDYSEKLDKTGQDYLKRIANASSHMDTLIENLLLLSRVGRKFMEIEVVDLNQLLEEIVEDLEPSIQKSNGKVVFYNLPKVSIPRTWMKQLFMNLINNGLKFNKSKTPRVEVTYEEREPELLFKVSDNGIGIEEKYFDRLFNLFERLHTQEEYEGTGAGLAICKKIVQQFGGRIWIESQAGKGSTFFFTLPKMKNPTSGGN